MLGQTGNMQDTATNRVVGVCMYGAGSSLLKTTTTRCNTQHEQKRRMTFSVFSSGSSSLRNSLFG